MMSAAFLAALLPVIPQPSQWTLSQKMWSGARADEPWDMFASIADSKTEPKGVKFAHSSKLK